MKRVIQFAWGIALIVSILTVKAQDESIELLNLEGDTITLRAIPLTKITASLETDYLLIRELKNKMSQEDEFMKFDSIYEIKSSFLEEQQLNFNENKDAYTIRELANFKSEWLSYEKVAKDWKTIVTDKISIVEKELFTITTRKKTWEMTQRTAKREKAPESVLSSVNSVLKEFTDIETTYTSSQNQLLSYQSGIGQILLTVDDILVEINALEEGLQSNYFVAESVPIWQSIDSSQNFTSLKLYAQKVIDNNVRGTEIFYQSNKTRVFVHLFLFLLIWASFFVLQKQSVIVEEDENEDSLKKAKSEISQHGLAAVIISLFISIWLYPEMNNTIRDVVQALYLIIALLYLPVFSKRLKPILIAILGLFLLDNVYLFIIPEGLIGRVFLFAECFLAAYILFRILKKQKSTDVLIRRKKYGLIFVFLNLFYALLLLSVIGNIFGTVALAALLSAAVLNAIFGLVIVILVILTLSRTTQILLRTPFFRKSNYINKNWRFLEKRITQIIYLVALFLWVKSIFRSVKLLSPINEWFSDLIEMSWKVGNSTIEFGGILSFLLVIILTVAVYRVVKTLLEEEFFPRVKLPRGVPGAISMIFGYVIVAYGIYLGLAAAGIDLSQFGLMAGALGVGIGFGLQNIVSNFIAGLILAFERPIQVGDTIEAGTVMGDVKTIGVRACTIRTFDGSEVMIPNGNLIANDVVNWTLSDRKKRRDIFVSVAYGSNPHEVIEVLRVAAESHPNVLQVPAPWILFEGFGDSALNFRVRIWTAMDVGLTTKSDVAMNIYDALSDAGIEIPFPQQDLHIKSMDPSVEEALSTDKTKSNKKV